MNLPDFLDAHPDGEIRLTGSRISLAHVIDLYNEGYSPEKIYEEFLSPSREHIDKVIAFYLQNRAAVDGYVAECHAQIERDAGKYPPSSEMCNVRRLMEALEEAETQKQTDPEWSTLPLGEKLRRLALLEERTGTA